VEEKMIRKLLFALLAVLVAVSASAQVNQNYTFLRSREGVPTFGSGLRPLVTAEMGIPVGTPFYDTSTYAMYYWSGSAWTPTAGSQSTPSQSDAVFAPGSSLTLCNTADCVTNYERATIGWSLNSLVISTSQGGTGSIRSILLTPSSGTTETYNVHPTTTDARSLGWSGSAWREVYVLRAIQGSKSKALTDAGAAVSFVRIAVPTNGYIGGKIIWTANSTDGTDRLTSSGEAFFAGSDKAGTPLCTNPVAVTGTPVTSYQRVNTLVCTLTAVVATTNCDLQVTCTDNLAGNQTMAFEWRLDMPSPATVTPQ
jgi:hypothetical protein